MGTDFPGDVGFVRLGGTARAFYGSKIGLDADDLFETIGEGFGK
jgi:hypothetical protein